MNIGTDSMKDMVYYLHQLEQNYTAELETYNLLVPGTLTCSKQGDRLRYFQTQQLDGKYFRKGITAKKGTIKDLCRKAYLEASLERIRKNIEITEAALGKFYPLDFADVYGALPRRYQNFSAEYFLNHRDNSQDDWAVNYKQSMYRPEGRTKITSRGLAVRSMAELVITEFYYKYDLTFRYEQEMTIGQHTVVPDYTVRRKHDRKIFIHEHCGMPYDEGYWRHHKWKLEQYEKAGFFPWDNLIVTYSDRNGNVDSRLIESEIVNKLIK